MGTHAEPRRCRVEIAWVDATGSVERREVAIDEGTSIAGALAVLPASEREPLRSAIAAGRLRTAIHGRLYPEDTELHDGDRIELVGELKTDPKLARRARVQQRRARSPKGGWSPGR